MMHGNRSTALVVAAILLPSVAAAHPGHDVTSGLLYGLGHPVGGIDHLLAMLAVGVIAAQAGGRSLWMLPIAFVGMMLMGGLFAFSGIALPMVETAIQLSLIAFGVLIAMGFKLPVLSASVLTALFGLFHGHAHGMEHAAQVSATSYMIGFAVSTAALHLAGIGIGRRLQSMPAPLYKLLGGVTVSTGLALAMLS
ncbi:HupE/UreJ family protein [Solemya velesiana gill symbiont]|nr:HupE/UreJ family protein [Solemya velesiana gill symbiont]